VTTANAIVLLGGNLRWQGAGVNSGRRLSIVKNTSVTLAQVVDDAPSLLGVEQNVHTVTLAAPGDRFDLFCYQNSGGALGIETLPEHSPEFWIMQVAIA
jgi:hypothetical protein